MATEYKTTVGSYVPGAQLPNPAPPPGLGWQLVGSAAVCHAHDEPRGVCSSCERCAICDAETPTEVADATR